MLINFLYFSAVNESEVPPGQVSSETSLFDFSFYIILHIITNNVYSTQLPLNPAGLKELLEYLKKYGNPPIYIHENGTSPTFSSSVDQVVL